MGLWRRLLGSPAIQKLVIGDLKYLAHALKQALCHLFDRH